jgi:hypothetical protein
MITILGLCSTAIKSLVERSGSVGAGAAAMSMVSRKGKTFLVRAGIRYQTLMYAIDSDAESASGMSA